MIKFIPYTGKDLIGLHTNENHYNFKFDDPDCHILFSVARRGNAAVCHVASDKSGLRKLKIAMAGFRDFVFLIYDWVEMIICTVDRASLGRVLKQIGAIKVFQHKKNKNIQIWIKGR